MAKDYKTTNVASDFRNRLRNMIRWSGGQQEIADRSGVAKRTVAKYLAGESEPTLGRLLALARAGGASIEWLVTGDADTEVADDAERYRAAHAPPPGSLGDSPRHGTGQATPVPADSAERFGRVERELASAIAEVGYRPSAMVREGLKTVMYTYGLSRAGAVVLLQFLSASEREHDAPAEGVDD